MEEKRFEKRRKNAGRRNSDDSTQQIPPVTDRRETARPDSPVRRNASERRSPVDRRIAPDPFDPTTSSSVEELILKTGILVACPQCNEQLTLGPVIHRQMGSQREVRCARCRKSVVIDNLP